MNLPAPIHHLFRDPRFWDQWFFNQPYEEMEGEPPQGYEKACVSPVHWSKTPLHFPFGRRHRLRLETGDDVTAKHLSLITPMNPTPIPIAWDASDDAQAHALRWDELEIAARLTALADPMLPHPGIPLLLLARFAPIVEDSADVALPMTEHAWRKVKYPEARIDFRTRQLDFRGQSFDWRFTEPLGWTLEQSEEARDMARIGLYSPRTPQPGSEDEFPFLPWRCAVDDALDRYRQAVDPRWLNGDADDLLRRIAETGDVSPAPALADALAADGCDHPTILQGLRNGIAAQVCWIAELLAEAEIGSVIRKHFGPARLVHIPEAKLILSLPDPDGDAPVCAPIADQLDQSLRAAEAGRAEMGFICMHMDRKLWGSINITLTGDLTPGFTIILDLLDALDPPERLLRIRESDGWKTIL